LGGNIIQIIAPILY